MDGRNARLQYLRRSDNAQDRRRAQIKKRIPVFFQIADSIIQFVRFNKELNGSWNDERKILSRLDHNFRRFELRRDDAKNFWEVKNLYFFLNYYICLLFLIILTIPLAPRELTRHNSETIFPFAFFLWQETTTTGIFCRILIACSNASFFASSRVGATACAIKMLMMLISTTSSHA